MGKATEIVRELEAQGPRQMSVRPQLKIREDAPSIVVQPDTVIEEVIEEMTTDEIVLRARHGAPQAVVLSPERYAELAGSEIDAEQMLEAVEGKIKPRPEALGRLMVEQVDQAQEWPIGGRRQN